MATASYHGANYTIIDNDPAVASFVEANEWGGNVKAVSDTFTATAGDTGSGGSFIYIGKVPKNSIPLCVILSTASAISWTGTIGYSGDPDAYGDFAAFAAAISFSQTAGPAVANLNTPSTQDEDIYITIATASIVDGDTLASTILYVQAG